MAYYSKGNHAISLLTIGLLSWMIPGSGYLLLKERKRAIIIFVTIAITFCLGIYAGSIGVIDPVGSKPWYAAQIMNSPMVMLLGRITVTHVYEVYGKPREIGQIYTSIAGLLNLLCIINAVYLAHVRNIEASGDTL